ncbi:MAG: transposase, partial [Deltaproteobacteria bacterium]|nr:transposase [Deltaproteobacteria bacterium]
MNPSSASLYRRVAIRRRGEASRVGSTAAATLEDALRSRKIDPAAKDLTLRSDNGLVFGARPFVKVVRRYGLDQEYITPYTPEQNGMIERFFGTLKSECVWQHRFRDRDHAFEEIARWLDRYHAQRP